MKSLLEGLRTLLVLGRVSNLPTVWSNLFAGWFLAGEGNDCVTLIPLLLGGSSLYIGGMYLNDFCDAGFDAFYCPERPIPAGKISRRAVGWMAGLWFAAGFVCLVALGPITAGIALLLVAAIVFYDFRHKNISWAPLVMGACRFLLYPLAASAIVSPVFLRHVAPAGITLGLYVAGITYLARGERRHDKPEHWALLLLVLPVAASLGIYVIRFRQFRPESLLSLLFFCLLFLAWMAWLLVPLWRKTNPSLGRVVSGLLAGIVLVDMIAVAPAGGLFTAGYLLFFALALLLQRIIPAT